MRITRNKEHQYGSTRWTYEGPEKPKTPRASDLLAHEHKGRWFLVGDNHGGQHILQVAQVGYGVLTFMGIGGERHVDYGGSVGFVSDRERADGIRDRVDELGLRIIRELEAQITFTDKE